MHIYLQQRPTVPLVNLSLALPPKGNRPKFTEYAIAMLSGNTTTSELISEAWNFDPAIDVEQYHNKWQMAEKMARSELQSLENDITSPDLTFLKRLDRLFAFLDIQENDAGLWQNYHPEAEMRKRAEAIGLSIASLQLEITSSPSLARLLGDTSPNVLNVMGERFRHSPNEMQDALVLFSTRKTELASGPMRQSCKPSDKLFREE